MTTAQWGAKETATAASSARTPSAPDTGFHATVAVFRVMDDDVMFVAVRVPFTTTDGHSANAAPMSVATSVEYRSMLMRPPAAAATHRIR